MSCLKRTVAMTIYAAEIKRGDFGHLIDPAHAYETWAGTPTTGPGFIAQWDDYAKAAIERIADYLSAHGHDAAASMLTGKPE